MNCANHPETPATAYCQFCGKPLCTQCVHKINNFVGCAPCLEARLHAATAGGYGASSSPVSLNTGQPQPWGTEPWIALLLGFIPGVGAMYNGQFAKGIAHVIIFVMLIDLTHYNGLIGVIIAAWIIYQVFDAYQTALARRNGLPLPNPLGLNNIGHWFGARTHNPYSSTNHTGSNSAVPPGPPDVVEPPPASAFASGYPPPASEAMPPYNAPPMPPNQYGATDFWHGGRHGLPTGAVILIVLGVLFLLGNLGILSQDWLDRGWPILLIALGVWIAIRRTQTPPAGGVR